MSSGDSFYSFWRSLGPKPQTTLRCFERGETYTLHDTDAILVAREYFNNLGAVKHYQTEHTNLPYITIKKSNTEFLRHFLLKRQYRVEIYASATKSGRDNDWSLKLTASPGNLSQLEDVLMSSQSAVEFTGLTSISLKWADEQLIVSLAFCDKESRRLVAGEFVDSIHLANLETALVQLESRECLIPAGLLGAPASGSKSTGTKGIDPTVIEHLSLIFQRAGFLATEVDKSNFALQDVMQDLNYLLRRPGGLRSTGVRQDNEAFEYKQGLACLGAIIKYLDLKSDDSNAGAFSLEPFSLDNFVRLDSAATRALHLLPGPDDKNRYQSVYGVLNNCRTQQGQRLLAQWLRQPLTDLNKINERLDMVEAMVEETGVRQFLHDDFLRRMPDFQRIGRKLQRKQGCGLQDIYRIYQAVARLQSAINLLHQCGGQTSSAVRTCLIEPFQIAVENFAKFQEMVQSTLDLEMIQRRNEYIIRSDFDDELGELKSKLDKLEESIEDEFRRSARKLNLEPGKSVKLDTNEQLGYFMRVTLKEEKILREFKSFEILDAQKGGVRFRNSTMSQLNASHLEVKQEYAAAQQTIVDEVLRITAGYLEPLHELNACTALLDVIVSLAVAACSAAGGQYVRPKLLPRETGRMVFKEMRHPCLELQDTTSVIPNDVHLERGKQIFLVITGPNMGGKSTYIRSIGVITAMAQIGSFVPCSFAELFPVDAVMARVGAADCQIRGVSTFMAEMLETSSVLRAATQNSLVIIDELGRGTSTFDGFGLAWAVASHLAGPKLGCFSLFATHFHELTTLAHHMPGRVANLRVTAQVSHDSTTVGSNVVMLYKVEPGTCTRSYGLDVAKIVGLPDKVLTEAEHKATRDEQLESLWLTLDKKYRTENCDESAAKRMRLGDGSHEIHASATVLVADRLREQLSHILDDVLSDDQSNSSEVDDDTFGTHVAQLTKALLSNSDFDLPQELLMLAS